MKTEYDVIVVGAGVAGLAAGAVISGTAAWATGGLSIALRTLWDRIQGTQNPCVRMLEPVGSTE